MVLLKVGLLVMLFLLCVLFLLWLGVMLRSWCLFDCPVWLLVSVLVIWLDTVWLHVFVWFNILVVFLLATVLGCFDEFDCFCDLT